jgi:hypothetical protein
MNWFELPVAVRRHRRSISLFSKESSRSLSSIHDELSLIYIDCLITKERFCYSRWFGQDVPWIFRIARWERAERMNLHLLNVPHSTNSLCCWMRASNLISHWSKTALSSSREIPLSTRITHWNSLWSLLNVRPSNTVVTLRNRQQSDQVKSSEKAGYTAGANQMQAIESFINLARWRFRIVQTQHLFRLRSSASAAGRFCTFAERIPKRKQQALKWIRFGRIAIREKSIGHQKTASIRLGPPVVRFVRVIISSPSGTRIWSGWE